ncbi:YidC/Oxa1 family membrane protein insertase [Patescibacteria group bacterium]|nr:YidC/Oxa1 family membrane protein insertase [Patescibacteria group bacterium]
MSSFSWMDLGVAVILITVLVKLILFPLTKSSIKTQIKIKEIEPQMEEIKEKYKDNKEELAKQTMEVYSKNQINPFASFFLVLIQLPILFALYFVFLKGGLPDVNFDILYSFIDAPKHIDNIRFLGLIDMTEKNLLLAILAGVSQFFQIKLVMPKLKEKSKKDSMKDDLVRNMQLQMKYIMPVFIFFIAYGLLSVVALYWVTSNLFMIGQELYVRKSIRNNS